MASLERVNDFLAQYHDVISPDEASSILREARHYAVQGLVPRDSLGYIMKGYYSLFIKFDAEPDPETLEPGHRGVI